MIEITFNIPEGVSTERVNIIARKLMLDRRFTHAPFGYDVKPDDGCNRQLIVRYHEIDGPKVRAVFDPERDAVRCELIEAVIERLNQLFKVNGYAP